MRDEAHHIVREISQGLPRAVRMFGGIGINPDDDPTVRLQKSILSASTVMMATLAIVWGTLYLIAGEVIAAAIPFCYSVASFSSLALFAKTKRYGVFSFSQLMLSLLLPYFLMLSLGNFVQSSGVVLWSLTCPLGALLFTQRQQAALWFLAFILLLVSSVLLAPHLRATNGLSPEVIRLFFFMNIGGVSTVAFVLTLYFVSQKDSILVSLNEERNKSNSLLLNVLPVEIAEQLKRDAGTIASEHEAASVLFADIVGFTARTERAGAANTVEFLNRVHSAFDTLVDRCQVEKIRTIGDAYMVASGVPRYRADHAQALAQLALGMQALAKRMRNDGEDLQLRIGINSGPLIAGVIGHKKFCYDVWGDTVNVASRMESHGEAGKIQISEETYELLKDEFSCELRGRMDIKGVGALNTWWLIDGLN